jgi:molecular chaperone DnaJ
MSQPNFEDIFEEFFRGFGQTGRRGGGANVEIPLPLTIQEAVHGVHKFILYQRLMPCEPCNATGAAPGAIASECPACKGTGEVRTTQQTFLGSVVRVQPCHKCDARGKIFTKPCPTCRGNTRNQRDEKVTVQIPAGIQEGVQMRLKGMGHIGISNAEAGDLLLAIVFQVDTRFERRGDDAVLHWQIDAREYQPGRQIRVPTLDGAATMTIPAQAEGKILRLRDKGFPASDGQGRGDQFIHLYTQFWQYYLHIAHTSILKLQRGLSHQISKFISGKPKNKSKTMPVIDVEFTHSDHSL